MSVSIDMTGKKVFFTGIDQGKSKEIALNIAKAGADIGVSYSPGGGEFVNEFKDEMDKLGRKTFFVEADPASIEDMHKIAAEIKKQFEGLDVLILNAHNENQASLEDLTVDLWESSHKVNVEAPVFLIQDLIDVLKESEERGRIINICNEDFYSLKPGMAAHANALASFVKAMQTLTVTVEPEILANTLIVNENMPEQITDENGITWNGCRMEDVAEFIMYLSVCVPTINGSTIPMDGGYGLMHYRTL